MSRSPCHTFPSFSIPATSASPSNLLVLYIKPLEPQEVSLCTLKAVCVWWGGGWSGQRGSCSYSLHRIVVHPFHLALLELISHPAFSFQIIFFKGMNLCPHVLTSKSQRTYAVFSLGPSYDPPGPEWDCRSCSSTRSNQRISSCLVISDHRTSCPNLDTW